MNARVRETGRGRVETNTLQKLAKGMKKRRIWMEAEV